MTNIEHPGRQQPRRSTSSIINNAVYLSGLAVAWPPR